MTSSRAGHQDDDQRQHAAEHQADGDHSDTAARQRRALKQAVRQVTAIRETILGDLDDDELAGALAHFIARTRDVLRPAVEQARAAGAPRVGTEHLLGAVLVEGTNLALHVLRAMEIEPERVGRDLARQRPATPETATEDSASQRFDGPAASALGAGGYRGDLPWA